MKTRGATSPLLLAALLAVSACKKDHEPHYGGEKTYGRASDLTPDENSEDAEINPADLEDELYPDEPLSQPPTPKGPEAEPRTVPDAAPLPAPTPASTDPEVEEDENAEPEDPVISPETLINHERYGAAFDRDSAIGIRDDRGYRSLGIVASRVRAGLNTTREDGMTVSQNFGDGVSRSTVKQTIVNVAADANRVEGTPSTSGDQIMDRVVDDRCPSVFVCIDKLVIKPLAGEARTFCFFDAATGDEAAYPYGAAPNYRAADFANAYGDYGPYTVRGYRGDAVNCDDPGRNALVEEEVQVEVRAGSVGGLPYYLHKVDVIPPQYVVSFKTSRVDDDLVSPYVDETVSLNHVAKYVMNEDVRQMVALVVTARQSIDIAQQTGGGLFGGIAGWLINLDGVQADLHFELCQDLLDPRAAATHCVHPED